VASPADGHERGQTREVEDGCDRAVLRHPGILTGAAAAGHRAPPV
jgi:hypothetical protein